MKPAIDHLRHTGDHVAATTSELALTRDDEWMGRKERKRELKRELDQVRVIDGWEQYRMLWDGIEFKRQLINMGDKTVRFALAIMAALNAALLVVLTRSPVVQVIAGLGPWLGLLLLVYGGFTFAFITHTIEALRPTAAEARAQDADEWNGRELAGSTTDDKPVGLFIRGSLERVSFADERQIWNNARLSDVNAELVLFNRSSSFVLKRQIEEIRKVYQRLKVLVVLATVMLMLIVGTGVVRNSARLLDAMNVSLR
jgi:hypothetical protein